MKVDDRIVQYLSSKGVESVDNCICYLFMVTNKLRADLNISHNDKLIANTLLETDIGITDIAGVKLKNALQIVSEEELDVTVNSIREKFQGIKPYSMGDKHDLKKKLTRFLREYPQYNQDSILEAVDYYLANTPEIYIRRANYFIYKQVGRSERSDLLRCLSEMKDKGFIEKKIVWS
jgi:hypothetical protein